MAHNLISFIALHLPQEIVWVHRIPYFVQLGSRWYSGLKAANYCILELYAVVVQSVIDTIFWSSSRNGWARPTRNSWNHLSTNYQPQQFSHAAYGTYHMIIHTESVHILLTSPPAFCFRLRRLLGSWNSILLHMQIPSFHQPSGVCGQGLWPGPHVSGISTSRELCWYWFYSPLWLNVGACVVKWRNQVRHPAEDA